MGTQFLISMITEKLKHVSAVTAVAGNCKQQPLDQLLSAYTVLIINTVQLPEDLSDLFYIY